MRNRDPWDFSNKKFKAIDLVGATLKYSIHCFDLEKYSGFSSTCASCLPSLGAGLGASHRLKPYLLGSVFSFFSYQN
mgnify:CR=1 FL=1